MRTSVLRSFSLSWRLIDSSPFVSQTASRLQRKNLVGRPVEHPGKSEGQPQTRDISVTLDRVDALTGDSHPIGELLLRPTSFLAQFLDSISDRDGHIELLVCGMVVGETRHVKLTCHFRFPRAAL